MNVFKKLFKQTFIYGLATVLPRALAIVLVPLYVLVLGKEQFGVYASLMAFLILGNVLLSYGMETAFFRFINKEDYKKEKIQSTALTSLTVSTLIFLVLTLVKMVLSLVFLLPLFVEKLDNVVPEVINFFISYFIFLIFFLNFTNTR